MNQIQKGPYSDQRCLIGIVSLCLFYLGFELFFNSYNMITVDEFWFAHRIYEYKNGVPYRDFAPYKTVLGYYLLLPTMLVFQGMLPTLVFMKHSLAIVNTLILLGTSKWLTRFFSPSAVLTSLALVVLSETFLSYSTNIRVDLIAYWFAFFSILFLLENRSMLAGICMGLGFITSQKCVWYLLACNMALGMQYLLFSRNKKSILPIILFNATFLTIAIAYLAYWSWITSWHTVYKSVFAEASIMYHLDSYENARKLYWHAIILYSPLLFLLSPFTLISALVTYQGDTAYKQRIFILTLFCIILACLIPFKQPFPYYMQVTFPIFFLLYAAFFDWLYGLLHNPACITKSMCLTNWILLFNLAYVIFVVTTVVFLQLPFAYLFILIVPAITTYFLIQKNPPTANTTLQLVMYTLVVMGGIYPLIHFTTKLYLSNSGYQKATLSMMQTLLTDNTSYLAGIELLYNKTQPIPGMRHLGVTAIDYLRHPSEKLRPAMLASLYATPDATISSVINSLKNSTVAFYINNYRMNALPDSIKQYLSENYAHLWGSIYLYAPSIAAGINPVKINVTGKYTVESDDNNSIILDGHHVKNLSQIHLATGRHLSQAKHGYRLKLQPNHLPALNMQYFGDSWEKVIY